MRPTISVSVMKRKPTTTIAKEDALHDDQSGHGVEELRRLADRRALQAAVDQRHEYGVDEGDHEEGVGRDGKQQMPAEDRRPLDGGDHLAGEQERAQRADGGSDEHDAELAVQTMNPRLDQKDDHRKKEHFGHREAESEVDCTFAEHFAVKGVALHHQTGKHGQRMREEAPEPSPFIEPMMAIPEPR